MRCPEDNAESIDQSNFWDSNGVHWDAHRIGWAIAGATAALTCLITIVSVIKHARNYRNRDEQRQIIRILYMPPIYAIISFFSYRFFRDYTNYSLIQVVYEAITLSAFLLLLIQYVAATGTGHSAQAALTRKDKRPLPIPFCFARYRPTKPKFMYLVKWSVMQYTIIRPAISIAGIITEHYGVLCESSWSYKYASVYFSAIDFVSISVALYGLLLFYGLTKDELKGRRPLAKFLCIKLIVMATFYQSFVFSALQSHGIIKATPYWSATDISDGLNALATCIEMVFFAAGMMWSYPASEYYASKTSQHKLPAWRALWDSINFSDFGREIYTSLKFFVDYMRGKPDTRLRKDKLEGNRVDFEQAFNLETDRAFSPDGVGRQPLVMADKDEEENIGMRPIRPSR